MNVVFVAFILKGSRDLMKSQQLYAPSVKGKLAVSFTPLRLSLKGAASILRIIAKVVLLRKPRRGCLIRVNGRRSRGEGTTTAGHQSLS